MRAVYVAWLGTLSEHTRRVYRVAVAQFVAWSLDVRGQVADVEAVDWAQVDDAQVEEWRRSLARRCKPATVNVKLTALSSWWGWLQEHGLVDSNPVDAVTRQRVTRARVVLAPEHVRALLMRIDRGSVAGLRDRAVLVGLLAGLPVPDLRWGEVPREGEVFTVIAAYLQADNRLTTIQSDDFVFVPLDDAAERLGMAREGCLSRGRVRQIVNRRARLAGLDPELVSPRALRATATEISWVASGWEQAGAQMFLGESPKELWVTVGQLIGL